jgi:hypothetical protein
MNFVLVQFGGKFRKIGRAFKRGNLLPPSFVISDKIWILCEPCISSNFELNKPNKKLLNYAKWIFN